MSALRDHQNVGCPVSAVERKEQRSEGIHWPLGWCIGPISMFLKSYCIGNSGAGSGGIIGAHYFPLKFHQLSTHRGGLRPNRRSLNKRIDPKVNWIVSMASMAHIPPREELDSYLSVALAAAREAGKVIVAAWDEAKNIEHKGKDKKCI